MNNNQGDNTPTSLPSIKDLIEGGPGLIGIIIIIKKYYVKN
jgi:hypothetical protein